MEFIIVLVVLAIAYAVYKAYFAKSATVVEVAPYKIETLVIDDAVAVTAPVKKPRAKKPAVEKKPAVKAKAARKPKAK